MVHRFFYQETAWEDSSIYDKPHACYYNNADDVSFDVVGNTNGITILL